MQSRRTTLWALTALLASSLSLSAGCDGPPTGQVKPEKVQIKVDELAQLELFVPNKFEGVHHEIWKIEPAERGQVFFNEAESKRREATFRGKTAGTGKILVHGFIGTDKHPYLLTEVPVTVE